MRKTIFFMFTSLDSYFEGPGRDINWHNVDDEFNEFSIQQTGEFGAFLFGRVTYELMAGKDKLRLKLVRTRTFNSGNVLLCYVPVDKIE